jgi:hypothetical protein
VRALTVLEETVAGFVELPTERELSAAIDEMARSTPVTVDREDRTVPVRVRWDGHGSPSYERLRSTDRNVRRRAPTERDGEP